MATITLKGMLNSVKNWFDWTPVSVSEPVQVFRDYRDKGHVLLGYEVVVNYKYHGERKYLFADDEEKMCLVTKEQARKKAFDFYTEKSQQIKQR